MSPQYHIHQIYIYFKEPPWCASCFPFVLLYCLLFAPSYLRQMAVGRACCVATYDKISHFRITCSFSFSSTDGAVPYLKEPRLSVVNGFN